MRALLLNLGLAALVLLGACQVPRVCREDEKARVEAEIAARTTALGIATATTLSLPDCEEIAIKNNLAYRVMLLETRLEDEKVREALAALLPQATAEFRSAARSNEPLIQGNAGNVAAFEDRSMDQFRIDILATIFDFGATHFAWQIAKDQRAQARLAAARARQTLVRDVRVAYAGLLGALAEEELVTAQVEAAKEELRAARALEREGLAAASDTAFVEATLARAELELTSAGRGVLLARAALARTLSVPTWTPIRIERRVDDEPAPPSSREDVLALEQLALRSRPEVWSQDLERHIAAAEVRQRVADFLPRLGGTIEFDWTSNSRVVNPSFWKGGIVVAQSLLEGGATISRYRQAKQQVGIEKERAVLVGMGVIYEVDFRVLELIRAHDNLRSGEKLVAAQDALLERVRSGHREGLESGANLARALADDHTAKRGLNAIRTQLLTAWYELDAAVASDTGIATMLPASRPSSQPAQGDLR